MIRLAATGQLNIVARPITDVVIWHHGNKIMVSAIDSPQATSNALPN